MDDEPSNTDRTPIFLGLLAFALAALLQWLPDVIGEQKADQLEQPAIVLAIKQMDT